MILQELFLGQILNLTWEFFRDSLLIVFRRWAFAESQHSYIFCFQFQNLESAREFSASRKSFRQNLQIFRFQKKGIHNTNVRMECIVIYKIFSFAALWWILTVQNKFSAKEQENLVPTVKFSEFLLKENVAQYKLFYYLYPNNTIQ